MLRKRLPLIAITAAAVSLLIFMPGHEAHASWFSLSDILGGAIGWIVYVVVLIISLLAGFAISLITYGIAVVLQMSNGVADSFAVQNGYSVMLSLVNLGFVLVVIIIAIATILKLDSYGVKKNLPRLIAAAILVNFGLLIGTVIINFSNSLTTSFLSVLPVAGSGNQSAGYLEFAEELAGAFAPEHALLATAINTNSVNMTIGGVTTQAGTAAATTQDNVSTGEALGTIISPIVGLFSAVALLIVITITLGALAIMLLIRYVMLAILLIVMPFAWLSWIFPGTRKNFAKWWHTFVRWTFFAPIVIFFLWLAIATAQSINSASQSNPLAFLKGTSGYAPNAANPIIGAGGTSGSGIATILQTFASTAMEDLLIVGLAIGGMIAADRLSIGGAGAAVGAMKSTGKYAAKKFGQGARAGAQRFGADKAIDRLQKSRIPGISPLGRASKKLLDKGGKDLVGEASKKLDVGKMDDNELILAARGARGNYNTLAVLAEAQKRGKLNKLKEVGAEKDLNAWLAKNDQVFQDYRQAKLKKDIDVSLASNNDMRGTANIIADKLSKMPPMPQIVDKYGILTATPGAKASVDWLTEESKKVVEQSKLAIKLTGANTKIDHNGRIVEAGDLLKEADETLKVAEAEMKKATENREYNAGQVPIIDTDGLLGRKGMQVAAQAMFDAQKEKFMSELSSEDLKKASVADLYSGNEKFGLSREAMKVIAKGFTEQMALKFPKNVNAVIGKLDSDKLINFTQSYESAINSLVQSGKMEQTHAKELLTAFKKLRKDILYGRSAPEPAAATPPPAKP